MDYQNISKEELIFKLREARERLSKLEKNAEKDEKGNHRLLSIIEQISIKTGIAFFQSLTKYIAKTLQVDYAIVGELDAENNMVKTISVYAHGHTISNIDYKLKNTPCDNVIGKKECIYTQNIQQLFPKDRLLVEIKAESYVGVPLFASNGTPLGIMIALGCSPMDKRDTEKAVSLMRIFSQRASAEIERGKINKKLKEGHQRLLTILDSLDALVYVSDMETYELLFVNKYGRDIWGDIEGSICWQKLQEDQKGPCSFCTNRYLLDSAGKPKDVYIWEFQNTKTNNWYYIHDKAIYWIDGKVVRLEIATDITNRKNAEKALKETLQTSNDIVQAIPSGLFIYKFKPPDKLILLSGNPESERLTGIKVNDWIGKEFNEIWPEAQTRKITDNFLNVARTGEPDKFEDLYYKDKRLEGAFRINVFRLSGNKLAVAFENITDRKQSRMEIEKRVKELEEFYEMAIHREVKMKDLKLEIADLKSKLSKYEN